MHLVSVLIQIINSKKKHLNDIIIGLFHINNISNKFIIIF